MTARVELLAAFAKAIRECRESGGMSATDIADEVLDVHEKDKATHRAEVLAEKADAFRSLFGDVLVRGADGDWADVAEFITTGARIPVCDEFYPHHTDTRCAKAKGHKDNHVAPWGDRTMAWPRGYTGGTTGKDTRGSGQPSTGESTQPAPLTDAYAAFMQISSTPALAGLRAELHIEGHPPVIGTFCGAGSRMANHHRDVLLIEPMLAFKYAEGGEGQ